MDEATANVDPENEAELREPVKALTAGKTLVMIAHRMKTVRRRSDSGTGSGGLCSGAAMRADAAGRHLCGFCLLRRSAESWRIAERKSNEVKAEV
ncbi:MAG: hypothetical protein ACLSB9_31610 [Hydrogeniiclostridium mannosilyticum]